MNATRRYRGRRFRSAGQLLQERVRQAGETRGFAVSRLLTRWSEIVGHDIAAMARPVKVGYGRGLGATLTLLVSGAEAQMVQMQVPRIIERVNACYGYSAIGRVHLTQTAAFIPDEAPATPAPLPPPDPRIAEEASSVVGAVGDAGLRDALERLALNVLSRKT